LPSFAQISAGVTVDTSQGEIDAAAMKISSTSCNGSWYSFITNPEGIICLLLAAGFVLSFSPFVGLGLSQLCNTRLFLASFCFDIASAQL
jgi:hypothetical protein